MTTEAYARVEIRKARKEDVSFVAWVMLAAARSHLERGTWDLLLDRPEDECLRYLTLLASTDAEHYGHYSGFLVAEVDGEPAAALCGYFEEERGPATLVPAMEAVSAAFGMSEADVAAGWARAGSIALVMPEHVERAWVVEWVATKPAFRRRGLVDRLLAEILDVGRDRGASTADIGVLMGNDAAQRAYEKAGFEVVDEKRHPEFEAAYRCPGVRSLRRSI